MRRFYVFTLALAVLALAASAPAQSDRSARTETQNQSLVDEFRSAIYDAPVLGHVLFVDSSRGTASAPGTRALPFSTIGAALSRLHVLEDAEGDNFVYDNAIFVYPEHSETLTAASSLSGNTVTGVYVALDGTKLIGLGDGTDKAQITLGTAITTDIEFAAANCVFENFEVTQGFTNLTQAITVAATADDLTIKDIDFTLSTTHAANTDNWIAVASGADDLTFDGITAVFATASTASDNLIEFAGPSARPVFKNFFVNASFAEEVFNDTTTFWTLADFTELGFVNNTGAGSLHDSTGTFLSLPTDAAYGPPWQMTSRSITFAAGTTGSVATHEIITVTGDVRMLILPVCTVDVTGSGAVQFGTASDTDLYVTQTPGSNIDTGELWVEAGLSATGNPLDVIVTGGTDVGYEVTTDTLTAGTVVFYIWWKPILNGGSIATADGTGTL